ncbi:MAG: FtsX-like permease family protein [Acetobacter sp.]|nr:FtsX-like permease family protein [Bacteroides sp.]MCM1342141.1 FtsX-like permease family protein [Acetobacter sp.]MCM1434360.1 FtsX-like permease family protein [Clostridiales bacterium]
MNIVNKLTLCHLRENKGRTIITTLGICVSVAMITAVFVAMASFINLFGNITLLSTGNQHATFSVNQEQLQKLKNDDDFSEIGVELEEENSYFELENAKSKVWGTGSIYSGDAVNISQMITGEYDGTIPKNHNEIAVEKEIIEKNGLDWKVGDTVSIPVGSLISDNMYDTEIKINATEQYKITAILHKNPATYYYSIIKCVGNEFLTGNENLSAHCTLEKVNMKSLDLLKSKIKEYKIEEYTINTDYLDTKFAADENGALMSSLVPIVLIVLIIIIIASVVLIYNSFGMSLSERVRYLGMLASVGATRRQKKLSVYFEGFILGTIAIPVGIVAGIIGIGITLKSVGSKIISTGMINGINDSNVDMEVSVPIWAIIGIIIFSILTIFISSFIPSRKASKITPIDAIRQREEIKLKNKKLRSPKIVKAVFGYEGELAYKNLKRNGRKSRVITASIALSLVLFFSCNYFCSIFTRTVDLEATMPYQINAIIKYEDKDIVKEKLKEMADVKDSYCVNNGYYVYDNDDSIENDACNDIRDSKHFTKTYQNLISGRFNVYVNIIDDDEFNKFCENNNIDYRDYYADGVKGIIMNNISHKENGDKVFNASVIGIKAGNKDNSVNVSAMIDYDKDDYICNLNPANSISVYTPYTPYYTAYYSNPEFLEESGADFDELMNTGNYLLGIETDSHEKVTENLKNVLAEMGYSGQNVIDYVESVQMMNTLAFILQVFVYGFIVLITMITVANIINTISTGIAMRRKEFAMLKSVGTTPTGFRKMVSLESVFYGLKALLFGLPLSILISFAMNNALGDNMVPFEIDWVLYLAATLVVFVITGFTMLYSVSKLKHDSIVETLKEDIV